MSLYKKIDTSSFYLTKNKYQILEIIKLFNNTNIILSDEPYKIYFKVKNQYGVILFVEGENNNESCEDNISCLHYKKLKDNEKSISENLKNGIFEECNKNSLVILKDQLLSLVLMNNKTIDPIIENYIFFNKNEENTLKTEGYFVFPIFSIKEIKNDPETTENHSLMLTACLRKYIINRVEKHYGAFLNSNQKIIEYRPKYENIKKEIRAILAEKIVNGYEETSILKSENKNLDGVVLQDYKNLSNLNDITLIYLDEISRIERLAKDMKKIEKEFKQTIEKLKEIKKSQM